MKNDSIVEQLKLQGQDIQSSERKIEINQDGNQENLLSINLETNQTFNADTYIAPKQESNTSVNLFLNHGDKQAFGSFISFAALGTGLRFNHEEKTPKIEKEK